MIGILNYRAGNIFSVMNALNYLQLQFRIVSEAGDLKSVKSLILPGVGNFRQAMNFLQEHNLIDPLKKFLLVEKKPFLGICLGMQLLFAFSEEGNSFGLGIFPEKIVKFRAGKVPLIGWNSVSVIRKQPLFEDIADEFFAYFVHSFYLQSSKHCAASAFYNGHYVAAVCFENIAALQFHPEKSGQVGLQILKNWSKYACR